MDLPSVSNVDLLTQASGRSKARIVDAAERIASGGDIPSNLIASRADLVAATTQLTAAAGAARQEQRLLDILA